MIVTLIYDMIVEPRFGVTKYLTIYHLVPNVIDRRMPETKIGYYYLKGSIQESYYPKGFNVISLYEIK